MVKKTAENTQPFPAGASPAAPPGASHPLEARAAAAPLTLDARSPLKEQEEDLKRLMRELESANAGLREHQKKSHAEMKGFLENLLEVLDTFKRNFDNLEARAATLEKQTKLVAGNFRTVMRLLERALGEAGVVSIEVTLGTPALPALHKGVKPIPTRDYDEGTILEVVKTGYYWGQEILRYPEVVVASQVSETSIPEEHGDEQITAAQEKPAGWRSKT